MKKTRPLLFALVFILGWWALAFHSSESQNHLEPVVEAASLPTLLSPLDRDQIQKALSGDYTLMKELIISWDLETQLLQKKGYSDLKRLSTETLLAVHHYTPKKTEKTPLCLPQTYTSASILFALTDPGNIVAIPESMREIPELYPKDILKQVLSNTHRSQSEALFSKHPDIAFVAPYSNPATVQTLKRQGIDLIYLPAIESFDSIYQSIEKVGAAIGKPAKAKLLTQFMEAALLAIDNRVRIQSDSIDDRYVFLNYRTHLSAPTPRQLSGQLLARLGFNHELLELQQSHEYSLPISLERLHSIQPPGVVIAADLPPQLPNLQITHFQKKTLHAASQYVVLTYFDLYQSLVQLCSVASSSPH